jgi:hypothetical protein
MRDHEMLRKPWKVCQIVFIISELKKMVNCIFI